MNCTLVARYALSKKCFSTMKARAPRACFDGVFSALPTVVQQDLSSAWRGIVDPAGALSASHKLTTAAKGYVHMNGANLYGALSPDVCNMDVTIFAAANNRLFGSVPSCLFLGGAGASIQVLDLHHNMLDGSLDKIGPYVQSVRRNTETLIQQQRD